jgi:hypothetical protein
MPRSASVTAEVSRVPKAARIFPSPRTPWIGPTGPRCPDGRRGRRRPHGRACGPCGGRARDPADAPALRRRSASPRRLMPIEVVRFHAGALATAVRKAAGNQKAEEVDQVRYLDTYLAHPEIAAKTMVVESPYVDRHYAQEFAGYYATTFHTPPAHATRLHFFDRVLEEEEWNERFGASTLASQEVDESYLGYVVVRPIPNCPIGRTALVAFPGKDGRVYEAARTEHRVHLCGMTLNVEAPPVPTAGSRVGGVRHNGSLVSDLSNGESRWWAHPHPARRGSRSSLGGQSRLGGAGRWRDAERAAHDGLRGKCLQADESGCFPLELEVMHSCRDGPDSTRAHRGR